MWHPFGITWFRHGDRPNYQSLSFCGTCIIRLLTLLSRLLSTCPPWYLAGWCFHYLSRMAVGSAPSGYEIRVNVISVLVRSYLTASSQHFGICCTLKNLREAHLHLALPVIFHFSPQLETSPYITLRQRLS